MIPGPALAPAAVRRPLPAAVHPAVQVMACLLAVASSYAVPSWLLPLWAAAASACCATAGLGLRRQAAGLLRWWPVGLLVLLVHVLTTTRAAPLGHPSWAGLAAGAAALARIATAAGALAVLVRSANLDDLVAGLRWWGAPLRRCGVADDDLGLALAVALGTAPSLLGEARRVAAVTELRRHGPGGPRRRGPLHRARDRAVIVVPLLEALGRRAEALTLSLRRRRPAAVTAGRPPAGQLAVLGAWTLALLALAVLRTRGGGW